MVMMVTQNFFNRTTEFRGSPRYFVVHLDLYFRLYPYENFVVSFRMSRPSVTYSPLQNLVLRKTQRARGRKKMTGRHVACSTNGITALGVVVAGPRSRARACARRTTTRPRARSAPESRLINLAGQKAAAGARLQPIYAPIDFLLRNPENRRASRA